MLVVHRQPTPKLRYLRLVDLSSIFLILVLRHIGDWGMLRLAAQAAHERGSRLSLRGLVAEIVLGLSRYPGCKMSNRIGQDSEIELSLVSRQSKQPRAKALRTSFTYFKPQAELSFAYE